MAASMRLIPALCAVPVAAHGGMSSPPARNLLDPSVQDREAVVEKAAAWYSIGCNTGCDKCSGGNGPDHGYNWKSDPDVGRGATGYLTPTDVACTVDGVPVAEGKDPAIPGSDTLPAEARTWNIGAKSGGGDWAKFNPWRAPGHSPISDPCGVASGAEAGAHFPGMNQTICESAPSKCPPGYQQGDPGSALPSLPGVEPTQWVAGSTAQVAWTIMVNHGGGYQYRLCPASGPLTEECFQANPLEFVGDTTVVYDDRAPFDIPALDVTTGTVPSGSTWRRNPIPACNCDSGNICRNTSFITTPYEQQADAPVGCPSGLQFPAAWPEGYGSEQNHHGPGVTVLDYQLMDTIKVPKLPAGAYVLSFRWDCEQSPQIWSSCADVVIVDSDVQV